MSLMVLKEVSIGYGNTIVGKHISLDFKAHQITCLLGANGCGKTTLLKTILGILHALSGEIFIDQKLQSEWKRQELARFVGYVPQAHHGVFPFTVEEMVLMGRTAHLSWYGTPQSHDVGVADRCLQMLGIAHLKKRNYMRLSGGERQLVLIARALAQQPVFLIMDEPTASLDFGNQIRVLEHIKRLKEDGLSILMTTHQPEHAAHIADHVILFFEGEIMSHGAPFDVLTVDHLARLYGLEKDILQKNLAFLR